MPVTEEPHSARKNARERRSTDKDTGEKRREKVDVVVLREQRTCQSLYV